MSTGTVRPWRRAPIKSSGSIAPHGGDGYTQPAFVREQEERENRPPVRLFPETPTYRWCLRKRCGRRFRISSDQGAYPKCCGGCRRYLRQEAEANGINPELPEEQLIDLVAEIAKIDAKLLLHSYAADLAMRDGRPREAQRIRRGGVRRSVEKAVLIAEANRR